MVEKPKSSNSASERELDKAEKNFAAFDQSIKDMTLDRMSAAPKKEEESQTKMSQSEISKSKDVFLKPKRTMSCREKFNEDYREEWNYQKEQVLFIAEHREIIGETIDMWTKPFAGVPAEEWDIPTNKAVWAPRYVAEQLKKCCYHRFVMTDQVTEQGTLGSIYGTMSVDTTVQRLDAIPTTKRKSIFLGNSGF